MVWCGVKNNRVEAAANLPPITFTHAASHIPLRLPINAAKEIGCMKSRMLTILLFVSDAWRGCARHYLRINSRSTLFFLFLSLSLSVCVCVRACGALSFERSPRPTPPRRCLFVYINERRTERRRSNQTVRDD
uniref:Uncharacterized protein n=1 Tax=Trypanosoma vivax (strain Y486) TaxID=1055687 RepID=G0U0J1_TRYVY|nr:hypothetical protein TVY486_0801990 [Trypanosoma vivax Y486]